MLYLGFYVFGIWDESQQISVQLKTPVLDEVTSATLHLCPKSLQVYSASLHAEADLTGLRGFIATHPYASSFLNVTLILVCEVLITLKWMKRYSRVEGGRGGGGVGGVGGDIVQPMREKTRKTVIKQVESLQPLVETQAVPNVPNDFSHMLIVEEKQQGWLFSFGGNTKQKIA